MEELSVAQLFTPPESSPPESPPLSPLSVLSKSPSLPRSPSPPLATDLSARYPSPTTTTPSGTQSPVKRAHHTDENDGTAGESQTPLLEGQPSAKRRKATPPKPRTTEYLDLRNVPEDCADKTNPEAVKLGHLIQALRKKKKIVVIAGAGISVSAGIPDFRSGHGLFKTLKTQHNLKASGKHLFDAAVYRHDSSTESFHAMVRELAALTKNARPTPFHHLLASLAADGRLMRLYTQNVDCIDTSMPPLVTNIPLNTRGPWPKTIQLHGGLQKMVCTKCVELRDFDGNLFEGPAAPLCENCTVVEKIRLEHANKRGQGIGRLRPRIVLYNESNPDEEAIGNVSMADLRNRPDAVIVVGTSLKIPGVRRLVKEFCQVTRGRRGGFTAWINLDSEPQGNDFKECWDLVVRASCDDVAGLAQLPPYDEKDTCGNTELSEEERKKQEEASKHSKLEVQLSPLVAEPTVEEAEQPPGRGGIEVVIHPKPEFLETAQGIPTPSASPKLGAHHPKKQFSKSIQSKLHLAGEKSALGKSKPARKGTAAASSKAKKSKVKTPPTNTLSKAFQTVKKSVPAAHSQRKKLPSRPTSSSSLHGDSDSSPLPPLRPDRPPPNNFPFTCEQDPRSDTTDTSLPPSTPTMPPRTQLDTISPKTTPRGMEDLID